MPEWTYNVRLIRTLEMAGIFDDVTACLLRKAYLAYRILSHRSSLRNLPATMGEEMFLPLRRFVVKAWKRFLGRE